MVDRLENTVSPGHTYSVDSIKNTVLGPIAVLVMYCRFGRISIFLIEIEEYV